MNSEPQDDYWSQDITTRLLERANTARQEDRGASIGDAVHFEQAAKEIEKLRNAMREAIEMLLERSHGNPARSPAHNARVCLQFALKGDVIPEEQSLAEALGLGIGGRGVAEY